MSSEKKDKYWRLYECIGQRGEYTCTMIRGNRTAEGTESRIVYVPDIMPIKWDADMICLMLGKPCRVNP